MILTLWPYKKFWNGLHFLWAILSILERDPDKNRAPKPNPTILLRLLWNNVKITIDKALPYWTGRGLSLHWRASGTKSLIFLLVTNEAHLFTLETSWNAAAWSSWRYLRLKLENGVSWPMWQLKGTSIAIKIIQVNSNISWKRRTALDQLKSLIRSNDKNNLSLDYYRNYQKL